MIDYRTFRNSDPPTLARLWNRDIPEDGAVRPVRVHELDGQAFGSACFDRDGLIVAIDEAEGRPVGFVHAGFGPSLPIGDASPLTLDTDLGTIAMLVVDPGPASAEVARGLVLRAERYLRNRGAKVLYAGGNWPLNPFYWGLYGGSEGVGILPGHTAFHDTVRGLGYESVATLVSMRASLDLPEPRDPRAVLIRRQAELEIEDDAMPADWWQNLAIGELQLAEFRLRSRSDGIRLAGCRSFDMNGFGRTDGRSRIGLIDVEVVDGQRRKGYGRYLVAAVLKWARERGASLVELQTTSTNLPALAFYAAMGFSPVRESTIYRLPAGLLERTDRNAPEGIGEE